MPEMRVKVQPPRCLCGGTRLTPVFSYQAPPEGEVRFHFSSAASYQRKVLRCDVCGHYLSLHDMDTAGLYTGDYVHVTYGQEGLQRAFERIVSLDPAKSDNVGRVQRILDFVARRFSPSPSKTPRTVLDVGSGLCVFLHRMKAFGWEGTALDPDPKAIAHARETVGVEALCGDFLSVEGLGRFDLVTFNKILEHVRDPVAMLAKARRHVLPGGVVYVEVPDGEMAVSDGPGREEFFIEHWHIFSSVSLALLASRSGFAVRTLERLREPSGKYTLWAFLVPVRQEAESP